MLRDVSWYVFLVVGIVNGLCAFGHGYSNCEKSTRPLTSFRSIYAGSQTLNIVLVFRERHHAGVRRDA